MAYWGESKECIHCWKNGIQHMYKYRGKLFTEWLHPKDDATVVVCNVDMGIPGSIADIFNGDSKLFDKSHQKYVKIESNKEEIRRKKYWQARLLRVRYRTPTDYADFTYIKVVVHLVELASENTSLLFKDQYGKAHAWAHIGDHDEVIPIESSKFKRYLARSFYEKSGNKVANADAINNAIQVIQAKAEFEGQTTPLSLRVAWYNGDIYYDLSNEKWQCVRISPEGWEVVNSTPIPMLVRYNQIPQADPNRNYEQNIFDKFFQLTNLKEEKDRILLKVCIVLLFIPEIPHVILILHGRQGSAKSTLQTMIKLLVDPAKPKLLTIYNDVKEFIQQLAHNYVAYYDNLKKAPGWLSDEACKAVTGVGSTKRKLYSDDDDIVYEYKRCLGFSGINTALTEPDALDRSMMIELQRINPEHRKDETVIMTEFFELRPKLLGYIFDILAKALRIKDTIRLNDSPRMADSALWGEAIARAMGYKDLEFINAYYDNIGKQNIEAIENHPLGQVIAKFYEEEIEGKSNLWEGQPIELLEQLELTAQTHKINTNHKSWPKEVRWLTRRLNQIRSNLLEGLGIDITIDRVTSGEDQKKKNTSLIKIRKMTPLTPLTPPVHNYAQIVRKKVETFVVVERNDSTMENDSTKNAENHAQNKEGGDSGDSGIIFSIEVGNGMVVAKEQLLHYMFKCYHCVDFQTNNKDYYEHHITIHHFRLPAYPSKAEIEQYGLEAQGKEWEI